MQLNLCIFLSCLLRERTVIAATLLLLSRVRPLYSFVCVLFWEEEVSTLDRGTSDSEAGCT